MTACASCGAVLDDSTAHAPHEPGCVREGCVCDVRVCPECCHECEEAA